VSPAGDGSRPLAVSASAVTPGTWVAAAHGMADLPDDSDELPTVPERLLARTSGGTRSAPPPRTSGDPQVPVEKRR